MFGRKAEAEAVVIMREKLHQGGAWGDEHNRRYYITWRFVVEVRPEAAPTYRAAAEQKIVSPGFNVPMVGSVVRVEYHEKEPDKVKLVLKGDHRYDQALQRREESARDNAGRASRDAAFRAALNAPPGTPPPGGWPRDRWREEE